MLPRTHHLGTDREGFFHSEQRLIRALSPRDKSSLTDWQRAAQESEILRDHASREDGRHALSAAEAAGELAARDEQRSADAAAVLGDGHWADAEVRLTVPRGTIVIQHADLFHRATRKEAGTPDNSAAPVPAGFRPMLALRNFTRMVEPKLAQQPALADSDGESVSSMAQASTHYLFGHLPPAPTRRDGDRLAERVARSLSEEERMSAAYMLGALAGDDREALAYLQALVTAEEECVRRACFHGLGIAGKAAVPFLAELLKGPATVLAKLQPSAQANVDRQQQMIVCAVHAALIAATHSRDSEAAEVATDAIIFARQRAKAELTRTDKRPLAEDDPVLADRYQVDQEIHFDVLERRRTLAQGAAALGVIGSAVLRSCMPDKVMAIVADVLAPLISNDEPGGRYPSFIIPNFVRLNASVAVLRLASDEHSAAATSADSENAPSELLGDLLGEAVRRLQESTDRTRGGFASRLLALVKLSGRLANRAGGLVPLVE